MYLFTTFEIRELGIWRICSSLVILFFRACGVRRASRGTVKWSAKCLWENSVTPSNTFLAQLQQYFSLHGKRKMQCQAKIS